MKIEITFKPIYWLSLTREDLEPLFILAGHHYDSACRNAAKPGGFIYGWRNTVSAYVPEDGERPKCDGTGRDLDTVLKICEGASSARASAMLDDKQLERVTKLCQTIVAAFRVAANHPAMVGPVPVLEPTHADKLRWAVSPERW